MSVGEPAIGIIGGSGLYNIEGLENYFEVSLDTPFGNPSDSLICGKYAGRQIYFLPRHARGHRLLPSELNHRANIYALRSMNVRWIISVGAVGSLQQKYAPRDIVLPSQFFDKTTRQSEWTFFGNGIVAHVSFAEPTCKELRLLIAQEATALGYIVHSEGTYVNMEGPSFSSRAESLFHQKMGFDVIGMTNLPEAKLAREAEISLASISFVTDYDCWKVDDEPVNAGRVIEHLAANADAARKIIPRVIEKIPLEPNWPEHRALDFALVTDRKLWPELTLQKLAPILQRFI